MAQDEPFLLQKNKLNHLSLEHEQKGCLNLQSWNSWRQIILQADRTKVRKLNLKNNYIKDDEVVIVASVEWLSLQKLNLSCNLLTYQGLTQLVACNFSPLKQLNLNLNNIGSRGAQQLIRLNLPRLQKLSLFECQLGNQGVRNLAKAHHPSLAKLRIFYNWVQNDGYWGLVQAGGCLDQLWVYNWDQEIEERQEPIYMVVLVLLSGSKTRVCFSNFGDSLLLNRVGKIGKFVQ